MRQNVSQHGVRRFDESRLISFRDMSSPVSPESQHHASQFLPAGAVRQRVVAIDDAIKRLGVALCRSARHMRPFRNVIALQLGIILIMQARSMSSRKKHVPGCPPRIITVLIREIVAAARMSDEQYRHAAGAQTRDRRCCACDLCVERLLVLRDLLRRGGRIIEVLCPNAACECPIVGVRLEFAPQIGVSIRLGNKQLAHTYAAREIFALRPRLTPQNGEQREVRVVECKPRLDKMHRYLLSHTLRRRFLAKIPNKARLVLKSAEEDVGCDPNDNSTFERGSRRQVLKREEWRSAGERKLDRTPA